MRSRDSPRRGILRSLFNDPRARCAIPEVATRACARETAPVNSVQAEDDDERGWRDLCAQLPTNVFLTCD